MKNDLFNKKLFKRCKFCKEIRRRDLFKYAHIITKSPYCIYCYCNKEYFTMINQFDLRINKAQVLIKKYGKSWLTKVDEYDFNLDYFMQFDEENYDFCIYCGNSIKVALGGTTNYHVDHMNPLSSGGINSYQNCVKVCPICNSKKGNTPFSEWLKLLQPKYRIISEKVYIRKHGYKPEQFVSSPDRKTFLSISLNNNYELSIESYPKIIGDINSIYSNIEYLIEIKNREVAKQKNKLLNELGESIFNKAVDMYNNNLTYSKTLKAYTEMEWLETYR